ncbi:MAG: M48 family metalloprotease [Synergistaceae bacterium]|nr:M48 family metalloprotease [Synergistaceae bacterium]
MMTVVRKNIILVSIAAMALLLFMPGLSEARLSAEDARAVWSKVAKATELTELPFSIKQETVPNAWVTNGSSVTVTTGLLELLDTQSELYGVLSHEAGHAKLNHYENTVKRGVGLSVAATLLGKLFGGGIAETAAGVGANLAYAGWSREQEVEADDYSVHLAHKMGEDPVGLYSALLKLSKNGKRGEPSGFNSHPPDERRLLHLRNEILSLNPKAKFPDGSEKGAVQQPQSQSAGEPENTVAKKGGYDIDAAIERMKKEEAAKVKAAEQNS